MKLTDLIRQAGAASEADTERNGFLSNHEESHAVGAGLGLGFTIGAAGQLSLLSGLLSLVLYGKRTSGKQSGKGKRLLEPKLVEDILNERHYFIAALAIGVILGILAGRVVSGGGIVEVLV